MATDIRPALTSALADRILVLDGAMGTMVQRLGLTRSRFPRRALCRAPARSQGQQRPARAHPARRGRGHPRPVPRGRRRHHRDQHLQRQRRLAGRLRPGGHRLRAERRGGTARPDGRGRVDGEDARPPALRGRRHGPDDEGAVDFAGREQPRASVDHVRRDAGRVPRAGPRSHRRRLRRAAGRDHRRHAEREGGAGGDRRGVRRARPPHSADDLGDDHGSQRADALGTDARRVLRVGRACPAVLHRPQLRPWRARDAAVPRRAGANRRVLRDVLPERRPAQRVRPVPTSCPTRPRR